MASFDVAMSYANTIWIADTANAPYPAVLVLSNETIGSGASPAAFPNQRNLFRSANAQPT